MLHKESYMLNMITLKCRPTGNKSGPQTGLSRYGYTVCFSLLRNMRPIEELNALKLCSGSKRLYSVTR